MLSLIHISSGYNQSDVEDFVPREIHSQVDNDTYYSFTLNKNLPTEGKYYVCLLYTSRCV